MTPRDLTPDQLLSTTRAVRKRLDLTRPVERELIEECLALAFQAPTGGNLQGWHFVLVTEPGRKKALAELYRKSTPRHRAPRPATSGRRLGLAGWAAEHREGTRLHFVFRHSPQELGEALSRAQL